MDLSLSPEEQAFAAEIRGWLEVNLELPPRLASLDEEDPMRSIAIARHLVNCSNPLPSSTCLALGLPPGSSYGAGAQAVLAKASVT